MESLPPEMMVKVLKFISGKEQVRISRASKKLHELVLTEMFRKSNPNLDVLVIPQLTVVEKIIKFATRLMVPVNKLVSLSSFITDRISNLNVLKLEFSSFNAPSITYNDFHIENLRNLQCLVLKYSEGSTVPASVKFPTTLGHFNLIIRNNEGDNLAANFFLSNVQKDCSQLEHISVNTNRDMSLKNSFDGMDLLIKKFHKTIRSALIMTALIDTFGHSLDFISNYEKLRTLIVAFNEGLISNSEIILITYFLHFARCKNLQTLSLISIPFLVSYATVFQNKHVYSNIKVLCLKNFQLTDKDFDHIFECFPNLLVLHVAWSDINYEGLAKYLGKSSALRQLGLEQCHCTEELLKLLVDAKQESVEMFITKLEKTEEQEHLERLNKQSKQERKIQLKLLSSFKDFKHFKLGNFFWWHNDSCCLSDECDVINDLILELENI